MTHEHLDLDITQPLGTCAKCRREVGEGEPRLDMEVETHLGGTSVTICRSCLSEHAPGALAVIENGGRRL